MVYFKFRKENDEWIIPVYEDSLMYRERIFFSDNRVSYVGEVTEEEYGQQFVPKETQIVQKDISVQLEFDF